MSERKTLFADVLLPVPVKGSFTYRVPFALNGVVAEGQRVMVPFGKKRLSGIVKHLHETPPRGFQVKYLETILDPKPVVLPMQFRFWEWIADYYLCHEGEVMHAALPFGTQEGPSWKPRVQTFVRLSDAFQNEDALRSLFDNLEKKAPRQLELLIRYIRDAAPAEQGPYTDIMQSALTAPVKGGHAALQALIKKGVFMSLEKSQSRFEHLDAVSDRNGLNPGQQKAWDAMQNAFLKHRVVLLHGVTSSGKTELYIQLIRETMAKGQQVLYLLPEIALTSQIIQRLQRHFGDRAGIYHSRFSPMERSEVWQNLLEKGIETDSGKISYDLVLGPRSAMFLPFSNLGLIIVDEEHEPSYKQQDPAPRYHARDAAVYLASLTGAKVLLGSATPSLESYHNAQSGKYGYASIDHRHGGVLMPEIIVADMRQETRLKNTRSHFSQMLYRHIENALKNQEQIILFQNRRGFSLRLECRICGWTPGCSQCDVSLVYHKKPNKLKCHYCGLSQDPPPVCTECGSPEIRMQGFGTEKIEEELPLFFPHARIGRMDLDTTRSKDAHHHIISDFEAGNIDILVGTQMVSKGLDFNNVAIVGILNADNMLFFPDFRSHERAFQLMAQVSGRAGRDKKRGKVIIQTNNPDHAVIRQVIDHDYQSMFESQLAERRAFFYPPFSRLVQLTLMHKTPGHLEQGAHQLALMLKKQFKGRVLGPEYPLIPRIRNLYIQNILIKLPRDHRLAEARRSLAATVDEFRAGLQWKNLRIVLNADPV